MEENLSGEYLKRLKTSEFPSAVLSEFFCKAFRLEGATIPYMKMFDKFLRMYSREQIFSAILDIYGLDYLDLEKVGALLTYMLKKKIDTSSLTQKILNKNILEKKILPKENLQELKDMITEI